MHPSVTGSSAGGGGGSNVWVFFANIGGSNDAGRPDAAVPNQGAAGDQLPGLRHRPHDLFAVSPGYSCGGALQRGGFSRVDPGGVELAFLIRHYPGEADPQVE